MKHDKQINNGFLAPYAYARQIRRMLTGQVIGFRKTGPMKRRHSGKSRLLVLISALSMYLMPLAAPAQDGPHDFRLRQIELIQQLIEQYGPHELPTIPVDQIFACGLYNVGTGQPSQLWHMLNFQDDGTVQLSIELNNGQQINGNGHYYGFVGLGLNGYQINMTYVIAGQAFQTSFSLRNVQRTPGLKMIRYFDAEGEYTENGSTSPIEMYCQAIGHGYNTASNFLRFECPDQVTPAGVYENVFEFNPAVPGQAFRQRDFYPIGSSNAIIERSEVGMYRQSGNNIAMDFNVNPNIPVPSGFSDFNELNAQLVSNGNQLQLVVDEFPPGEDVCNQP